MHSKTSPLIPPTFYAVCLGLAVAGTPQIASAVDGTWANTDGGGGTLNWSDTANWDSATVADGTDAIATFLNGSPLGTSAVIVDTNITIGTLSWYNSTGAASDFSLAGSSGNALTFATTTGVPMIEIDAANNRLLNLGGDGTLNIQGTQGLIFRVSPGGALTGAGLDATSSGPSKQVRVYDLDYTGFSGGITVDRGEVGLKTADQLGSGATTQGLTVGTADTVTFDRLAGLAFDQNTQVTTLDGNSLGRIYGGAGKVFTVGVNDADGGDFGGVFGVNMGGTVQDNDFVKIGTGTQTISGRINTLGDLTVSDGKLAFTGTSTGNSVAKLDGASSSELQISTGADLTINADGGNYLGVLTGDGTLILDAAGGKQRITYNAGTTFDGLALIKAGTLELHNTGGAGALSTADIQLGDASGQDATLQFSNRGGLNDGQTVTVVGGGTNTIIGTRSHTGQTTFVREVVLSNADLTIRHTNNAGYRLVGDMTGTGNLSFEGNTGTVTGGNNIEVRAAVNNVGTVTNQGTGYNNLHINGGSGGSLGANVTGITQNSATSEFIINSNNSSFAGTAAVESGTMRLQNAAALSVNNVVSVSSGATLDLQENLTLAGLNDGTGGGTVTNEGAADQTLTLAGSGSYGFSGSINDGATNKLSVTTSGSGTHTLGGSSTYSGLTTINSGTTLKLGSASALGSFGVGGDETDLNSGGILDLNGQTTAETLIDISGTIINSNTSSAAGISTEMVDLGNLNLDGDGDITIDNIRRTNGVERRITKDGAGTLTLSGSLSNNRYGLTVNKGDVLLDKPDGVEAVSRFALIMNNASSTVKLLAGNQIHNNLDANGTHEINAGTLDLNGFDEGIARIDTLDTDGVVTNSDGGATSTFTLLGGDIDATFAGTVTGNLNLVKEGNNTQTLTGANTYTGTTAVNGGLLQFQGDVASDNFSIASGATLEIDTTAGNQQFNGGTISGDGTLIKSGTGNMLLGANGSVQNVSMSGGLIDVQGGTLRNEYGNGDWSANQASLNVASGATVDTWDSSGGIRVDALTGEGTVTHTSYGSASNLTVGVNGGGGTFSGLITDDGVKVLGLVKEGAGTQILTGNNNYQGSTTIDGGTLQIGDGGETGTLGAGAVVNNSVLAFNRSNTFTIANDISGTGSLELTAQVGSDSSIGGTNTYSGGTTINSGRFRVANDGNLGDTSGALTLNGGGLKNNSGALTLDAARNVIIGAAGGQMQAGWNSALEVAGVVSGSGDLTIEGDSGTVVLSNAANTYSGEINLQDANSKLSVESLGAGASVIGHADATFTYTGDADFDGAQAFFGTTVIADGATVTGAGSLAGNLTLESGSMFVFSDTDTLTVSGDVSLFAGFGVDDIQGLGAGTAVGTYTLIDGTATDFSTLSMSNFGEANWASIGGGKFAYFQNGSLQLVVAVPEPGTFALLAGMLALSSVMIRRRRS